MNPTRLSLACVFLSATLASAAAVAAESADEIPVPQNYAGVGGRFYFEEGATVLNAKFKVGEFGRHTVSVRPVLLVADHGPEGRFSVSVDRPTNRLGFAFFGGMGLSFNMDDLGQTDAMLMGGIDVPFKHHVVLNLTADYLWQDAISDTDAEVYATLNYGF